MEDRGALLLDERQALGRVEGLGEHLPRPVTIDIRGPSVKPNAWKSGRYIMITSAGVIAMRKARSVALRMIAWSCIAPFGNPVVPDV